MPEYSVAANHTALKISVKSRRQKYILSAVLLLLAAFIGFLLQRRGVPEPSYQGKPLSQWLEDLDNHTKTWDQNQRAVAAIRALGTNALPFLLAELRRGSRSEGFAEPIIYFGSERRARAAVGLGVLGQVGLAKRAVPDLARMVERGKPMDAYWALKVLRTIEPEGLVYVRKALTNKNEMIRETAEALLR